MQPVLDYLFGAASFVPHGYCLLWRPDLVAMHAISDFLIAVSYFTIPAGLWYFARQRKDLEFKPLFYLFAAFILFCGLTHVAGLATLWYPAYGAQGLVKAATAIVSVLSAIAIWPTIPKALAAPGVSTLRLANQRMEAVMVERTAALTAATRELDAFASSIAHDLRTPLRSINGFAAVLSEEHGSQLGADGKQMVERIGTAALRMSRLMDDLLTMSRLTRAPLHRRRTDISGMAHDIAGGLRRLEPEHPVECSIAPGIELCCDPALMRTALTHLLGNGWKFTGGQPCPKIELGHRRQNGKDVLFVRDNGVGFDMAYSEKLFAPFQRLHRPEEFPGNGIGLAIVARIVHRHGGEVSAEASLGKGTTVTITLP